MKISRRDFLKKFAAMAAAGTMARMPQVDSEQVDFESVEQQDDEKVKGPYEPELAYGEDWCHLCELEPWACDRAMYWCPKDKARWENAPVEIKRYDWKVRKEITTGIVYP